MSTKTWMQFALLGKQAQKIMNIAAGADGELELRGERVREKEERRDTSIIK